ncbi:MAG: hypothetical protein A2Y33_15190 [Spirochaetes bacterium GWF1_51_8]|nr:MAG: hypothetical protein A2Y33_15190 [Spirochaetes bacterium GWF1_51_8]
MNIVLLLTDNCNLRCTYCYYKGIQKRINGNEENIKTAIGYFYKYAKEMNQSLLNITFFGGEPLLFFNLLKTGVEYADSLAGPDFKIAYAINTNATLFTKEIFDYLEAHNFLFYVSLDGMKQTQDEQRPLHNGAGSYDLIKPWIPRLAAANTMVEKVITPENVSRLHDDIEFIVNQGFRSIITSPDFSGNWTRETFEILEREYEKLIAYYIKKQRRGKGLYLNVVEDKIKAFLAKKSFKETCCNLGQNIFAVTPGGIIFPCTRFAVNDPDSPYIIGTLEKGVDPKKLLMMSHYHAKDKPQCEDCTIKDRCLGNSCGCISYSTTGDIDGISPFVCEHERMLTRLADELAEEIFS